MRIKRSYSRVPAVAVIQFLTECDQLFLSWQGAWQTGPVICSVTRCRAGGANWFW